MEARIVSSATRRAIAPLVGRQARAICIRLIPQRRILRQGRGRISGTDPRWSAAERSRLASTTTTTPRHDDDYGNSHHDGGIALLETQISGRGPPHQLGSTALCPEKRAGAPPGQLKSPETSLKLSGTSAQGPSFTSYISGASTGMSERCRFTSDQHEGNTSRLESGSFSIKPAKSS